VSDNMSSRRYNRQDAVVAAQKFQTAQCRLRVVTPT